MHSMKAKYVSWPVVCIYMYVQEVHPNHNKEFKTNILITF